METEGGCGDTGEGVLDPWRVEGQGDLPEGVTPDLNLYLLRALLGRRAVVLGSSLRESSRGPYQ